MIFRYAMKDSVGCFETNFKNAYPAVYFRPFSTTMILHKQRKAADSNFLPTLDYFNTRYGDGAMYDWLKRLVERRGVNKACVALASKNARIAWKMLIQKTEFQAPLGASA